MKTTQTNTIGGPGSARRNRERRSGAAALALALAGVLFLLYPVVRPFSDETSLQGAAAFASTAWLVAHSLAMVAFILLPLGLHGIASRLRGTPSGSRAFKAVVLSWVGVGLTLPFYGAETFSLAAIGQEALERGDVGLLSVVEAVQTGPGLVFIGLGLVLLAAGAIVLATALRAAEGFPTWSGVPLAAGLVLYVPQFLAPQPVRVAHGVLMAIGCLVLARQLATMR